MANQEEQTELEKQYQCSAWSHRFPSSDQVLEHHIEFVQKQSKLAREKIAYETIYYGSGTNENFDLFGTNLPDGLLSLILLSFYFSII